MYPVLLTDELWFPDPLTADARGLVAVGGDLSVERLLLAYSCGIFPWYSSGDPLLWWSPDPRLVLFPSDMHVPSRLRRSARQKQFHITMDRDFRAVIQGCATSCGRGEKGTWITDDMVNAYLRLHQAGYAHSVEAWQDGKLAGGLYGVAMGAVFFGESMFFHVTDASKCAFVAMVEWFSAAGGAMIDCQVKTGHLMRFGAREIPRRDFLRHLRDMCTSRSIPAGSWDSFRLACR